LHWAREGSFLSVRIFSREYEGSHGSIFLW
jgi:hypothetical protein